jgi:hypothetical protein
MTQLANFVFTFVILQHVGFVPSNHSVSAGQVLEALDKCPSYGDISALVPSHGLRARVVSERVSESMRKIQPATLDVLNEVVRVLVARSKRDSPENKAYVRKMLRSVKQESPGLNDEDAHMEVVYLASRRASVLLWVDRFLFNPPKLVKEPGIQLGFLRMGSRAPIGYMNRLYPVTVTNGVPQIDLNLDMFNIQDQPAPAESYAKEFKYYSTHYPRRKGWR